MPLSTTQTAAIKSAVIGERERRSTLAMVGAIQAGAVDELGWEAENPPTQTEMQTVVDKIDELIAALKAAGLMAVKPWLPRRSSRFPSMKRRSRPRAISWRIKMRLP